MTETDKKAPNPCRVRSALVRLAFVSLDKKRPRARGSDKMTFQATLLVQPKDIAPFVAAEKAACIKKWNKEVPLKERGQPIKKCEDFDYAGYEKGWFAIGCNSDMQPPVVDKAKQPIPQDQIATRAYSGVWAHVVVDCFAWQHESGGKGVSFDLKAVQIVKDDERLDGRGKPVDPDEQFEALEMEDEGTPSGLDDLLK